MALTHLEAIAVAAVRWRKSRGELRYIEQATEDALMAAVDAYECGGEVTLKADPEGDAMRMIDALDYETRLRVLHLSVQKHLPKPKAKKK